MKLPVHSFFLSYLLCDGLDGSCFECYGNVFFLRLPFFGVECSIISHVNRVCFPIVRTPSRLWYRKEIGAQSMQYSIARYLQGSHQWYTQH